jgi:molybdenum cofactor biosynthesis protein MoaC
MLTTEDAPTLTHVDPHGKMRMVDTSLKADTVRTAVAVGRVVLGEEAFRLVEQNEIKKGDALVTGQLAGIQAAKHTSTLIPLCHTVLLRGVDVDMTLDEETFSVEVRAFAKAVGPTGVEMEALMAVSVAALTVYDMCKSVSKEIEISDIKLLAKTGGQSGDYRRA